MQSMQNSVGVEEVLGEIGVAGGGCTPRQARRRPPAHLPSRCGRGVWGMGGHAKTQIENF
jgi:hypothetical protein